MINILRDDIGILSLIRQNKKTEDLEENVEAVLAYPGVKTLTSKLADKPPRSRDQRRHTARSERNIRRLERRLNSRRQLDLPVLLDTRTTYERRNQRRRSSDLQAQSHNEPSLGIDKFT